MIRVITDSASDITQAEAKVLGIDVIPLKTRFGNDEYLDGIDIDNKRFFEMLIESDENPTTSCASPGQFMEIYEKYPDDDLIYIAVSAQLSGCYQSAMIAKGDRENIYLIDSLSVSPGQRILIERALLKIKEGKSGEIIANELNEEIKKLRLIAMVDTLEYLKRGGRISASVAMIGGLLSIKPVVELKDGLVNIIGKARGSKNAQNFLNETIEKYGGIDFDKPLCLAYSGTDDFLIRKYAEDNAHLYEGMVDELPIKTIGSTIGTHVGPGAIAVAYFAK